MDDPVTGEQGVVGQFNEHATHTTTYGTDPGATYGEGRVRP